MDGDDAARFDPPAAARQKDDIHPAGLRLGERLLDAGYREYRSPAWRAASAAESPSNRISAQRKFTSWLTERKSVRPS